MFCTACAAFNPIGGPCASCGTPLSTPRPSSRGPRPSRLRRLVRLLYLVPVLALLTAGGVAADRYRSTQADQAAWYARAEAAVAAGHHANAAEAFANAGGYRDAEERHAAALAALAPYRAAYLDGAAALDAGHHDEAIAALLPVARDLPGYADAAALLERARAARAVDLDRRATIAAAEGDWLAADRALAALAADAPEDQAIAARLADLRREHAPLVVARDRSLHLVSPDGSDDRVLVESVPATWPAWSPDRTQIAFLSIDHADPAANTSLYVVGTDGTGLRRLDDWVSYHDPPVWSPDGAKLAYVTLANWTGSMDNGSLSIRVADLVTGEVTDLTHGKLPLSLYPTWSPTGDRLAFVSKETSRERSWIASPSEVRVYTFATGELTDLTAGRLPGAWSVAWSPTDERLLVYTLEAEGWYDRAETGISLLDVRTGAITVVRADSESVEAPVWSPDGASFAYADGTRSVRIRGQGLGESWINVPTPIAGQLTWSPDGSTLLAVAEDPHQPAYFIPVADGAPTPIPFDYDVAASPGLPQWSPINLASPTPLPALDLALDRR